jgi:hypothetical protein
MNLHRSLDAPGTRRLARAFGLAALALVLFGAAPARSEECEQLKMRWRSGNYGLKADTGWPRRPDGEALALFELDAVLEGLRRQVMGLYSQFGSGKFVVEVRGGTLLADLVDQLSALESLYARQPSPRLAGQILALRRTLQQAPLQLEQQSGPLKARYDELQALARKARSSMRELLHEHCGALRDEGFLLANWEALPAAPPLAVGPPPAGLTQDAPEPEPEPASPLAHNPLWAELGPPPAGPAPAAPALTPAGPARAGDAAPARPREAAAPRTAPAPTERQDVDPPDDEAFLRLLAMPDEDDTVVRPSPRRRAAGRGEAERRGQDGRPAPAPARGPLPELPEDAWSLFPVEAEPDTADEGADGAGGGGESGDAEELPVDPAMFEPRFGESTLPAPAGRGSDGAAPRPPGADAPPAAQEGESDGAELSAPGERDRRAPRDEVRPIEPPPLGPVLLSEDFSRGMGPERIGGSWLVVDGVLKGKGTPGSDAYYVLTREAWIDYQLDAELRIDGGDNQVAVVLRSQSETRDGTVVRSQGVAEDAYLVRLRAVPAAQLSFHDPLDVAVRRKGEIADVLCGRNVEIRPHVWYRLRVRHELGQLSVALDGKPLLSCQDESFFSGAAMLGLIGRTEAQFDNILVRALPGSGSDLPLSTRGVPIELPAPGSSGWGRLGGRFTRVGSALLGEAPSGGPALVRRLLQDVLQETGLSPRHGLEVHLDVRSIGQGGGGGLLFGGTDGRFLAVVLLPGSAPGKSRVQLLRRHAEAWESFAVKDVQLDPRGWHRLGVVYRKDALEVRVDGRMALRGRTSLPPLESVGVYVEAGSRMLADRLVVAAAE